LSTVTIGSLSVGVGEKKHGELVLAQRAISKLSTPITVIRGNKPGPTLAVIAGEHGCEYCGITAAVKLCSDMKPEQIAGTLVVVPLVNIPAFEARSTYVNPVDTVNIWSAYPGDTEGSISYSMTKTIFDEVVLKSNYVVHLHGGDANEATIPYAYFSVTGNKKVDEASEAMARSFPVDFVLPMIEGKAAESLKGSPKGTSYTTSAEGCLYREASIRGIPGALCESGRDGKIEREFVDLHYTGVLNVMRYLGMIEGKPSINTKARKMKDPQALVSAHKGGLYLASAEIGQEVKKGQVLGEILNLHGEVVETLRSPIDGVLICRSNYAAVDANPLPSCPYLFYITQVE